MRKLKYNVVMIVMVVSSLAQHVSAQSTVTIREVWSTPTTTAYSINTWTHPSIPTLNTTTTTTKSDGLGVFLAKEASGPEYQRDVTRLLAYLAKCEDGVHEFGELDSHFHRSIKVSDLAHKYGYPKEARLRKYYKRYSLEFIFNDIY
jgi:hypothetical protein